MNKHFHSSAQLTFILLLLPFLLTGQTETYIIKKTPFSTDEYAEFSPMYFKNGLVFCTDKEHGIISYTAGEDGKFINLYYIDTTRNSGINTPVLFSKEITTKFNDGPVSFDSSEDTVYFSRNIMVEGKLNKLSSRWNKLGVFSAVNKNGQWTDISDLGLNSKMFNLITPSLTPDGKRLYYASDMPGGFGGTDLYYSERNEDNNWGKPVNLGPVINSEGNESYPFINSKGEFFFSSERASGIGGKDIYFTRYEDGWKEPVLLDPPINSEYDDFGLISENLLHQGYFSSNRGNSIDIYHFTTVFPQIFEMNFQKENDFCYTLHESNFTEVDTSLVRYLWNIGEESVSGQILNYCFPGPGEYKIHLDVVEKTSGDLFFRNSEYLLKILKPEQAYIHSSNVTTENETIEFDGMRSDFTGYTILNYAWDFGDNTRKNGPVVTHSYSADGEYDVNLFLTLKSSAEKIEKTSVARKVIVFNTIAEKNLYTEEFSESMKGFTDIAEAENAIINEIYKAEDSETSTFFCLELLNLDENPDSHKEIFQTLPDKYNIKIRRNADLTFSYTVLQQENLMEIYPSYLELRELGFKNARVIQISPEDPAEKELFRLVKKIDNSIDSYFNRNEQLTASGREVLDQITNFLNKYPSVKMEVSVHTDNSGYPSDNLSTSQLRAKTLTDYLVSKGIDRGRLITWGYGGSKPIALNISENGRKQNRRVEFNIFH